MKRIKNKITALILALTLCATTLFSSGTSLFADEPDADIAGTEVASESDATMEPEVTEIPESTEEPSDFATLIEDIIPQEAASVREDYKKIVLAGVDLSELSDEELTNQLLDDEWYVLVTEEEIISQTELEKAAFDELRAELIEEYNTSMVFTI